MQQDNKAEFTPSRILSKSEARKQQAQDMFAMTPGQYINASEKQYFDEY